MSPLIQLNTYANFPLQNKSSAAIHLLLFTVQNSLPLPSHRRDLEKVFQSNVQYTRVYNVEKSIPREEKYTTIPLNFYTALILLQLQPVHQLFSSIIYLLLLIPKRLLKSESTIKKTNIHGQATTKKKSTYSFFFIKVLIHHDRIRKKNCTQHT